MLNKKINPQIKKNKLTAQISGVKKNKIDE